MAEGGDDQDRTEQASAHKLDKAREEGKVAVSREVASAFVVVVAATGLALALPPLAGNAAGTLAAILAHAGSMRPTANDMRAACLELALNVGLPLLAILTAFAAATILATVAQGAFVVSTKALQPKLERLSPLAGLKRLVSPTMLKEFCKNLLKLAIIGTTAYLALAPSIGTLALLPGLALPALLALLAQVVGRLFLWTAGATLALAALDWFLTRQKFLRDMRMSKKEMADEHKEQDGDPHIKGKLKQIRMQRARNRMMAEVPKATVVITNPTHFAVALRYDQTTPAPIVIAKGADAVALRIRELAAANGVPVIESPPLARALYRQVELDRVIPTEHYQAVAEIIAAIMRVGRIATA
ncbi:flagellar biosynthetic protein FlhB [Arboricoccus pini]|uniref:Flagellar biosynthetic protein FlhB n=1 Tax=Arboricoccus pini TaxID=1963835 RepID=A0A212QUY9_9PROT|nr:flagellar biosynthesis protein FlhB [Arboricoccus pini]SNB63500.1 flagellar biosynthetic protein FlhB [Arboricoccus pini]